MASIVKMDGTVIDQAPPQPNEGISEIIKELSDLNDSGQVVGVAIAVLTVNGYKPMWDVIDVYSPYHQLALLGSVQRLLTCMNDDISANERVVTTSDDEGPA